MSFNKYLLLVTVCSSLNALEPVANKRKSLFRCNSGVFNLQHSSGKMNCGCDSLLSVVGECEVGMPGNTIPQNRFHYQ